MSKGRKAANPKMIACAKCLSMNTFEIALHVDGKPPFWTIRCQCADAETLCLDDFAQTLADAYNTAKGAKN